MKPLETYLRELHDVRSYGVAVKETSYYGKLEMLLNEVGKTLKPRVRCIINIKSQGAGIPDGGLFTPDQVLDDTNAQLKNGPLPARGAVEVKGTGDEVREIAHSDQVAKYLGRYGQVLVTNYRHFLLVRRGPDGEIIELEEYSLAESEADFWAAARNPHKGAEEHGERFVEYLKRAMLYAAPLTQPRDVAWFLASYAREARMRVEKRGDLPALSQVRSALEQALGLRFEGKKGGHFFQSTLVQTLFYGIFSAWVLWSKQHSPTSSERFNWHDAAYSLKVPMIRTLFEQVAMRSRLEPLGLTEVLDWTGDALNRVDRAAFFDNFDEEGAVQYFYEPFLEAFDPDLRKQLGVWYTPPEVVRYMVERVDTVLREELGLADGLADPSVYVLDPCTGTGSFPLEVLKRIEKTLREKGEDALVAHDLKKAAMERVFGFEILPAPFVVAHLQLGLLLQNLGAPLSDEGHERAGVYLTNALTGWDPSKEPKQHLLFPELEEERDAAEGVKRFKPVLVVLGNPPYNAFAGVSPDEEQGLAEAYKQGLISEWGIKKFNLDDLYVRFFRLAERRIVHKTGKGVVCYISNFSYLTAASFVVMRQRFLDGFDKLWFDSLNGDSRETGKLTPQGEPDPSVFSTPYNREGIRVGTTVGLMVRKERSEAKPTVRFRDFWGINKRADLLESLKEPDRDTSYETANPKESNRYSLRPSEASTEYLSWPKLTELCAMKSDGLFEKRGGALIDIDRHGLEKRMRAYYDATVNWETLTELRTGLTKDAAGFDAKKVRSKVQAAERYLPEHIRRYAVRPFDIRWCHFSSVSPLWNRSRPALWEQYWHGNKFLVSRMKASKAAKGSPMYFSSALIDGQIISVNPSAIPMYLYTSPARKRGSIAQDGFFSDERDVAPLANLSPEARAYVSRLHITDPDVDAETVSLLWMHALAIGYSPSYLTENADGIQQDWPRIPLPDSRVALVASAELGRQVAALLDNHAPVAGVTSGTLRPELRSIAMISREGGGALNPDAGDLALTVGWGHKSKAGVVMPGRGKIVEREYTTSERESVEQGAAEQGLTVEEAFARLGETTFDIYLNGVAYWRNVPARVWDYTIGGYQVMKKWLSYRESGVLGRALTASEVREVADMARRLAAILLLEPYLDANYTAVKEAFYNWPEPEKRP